jgi:serine/threonine-protein kinase RsbW
VSDSAISAAPGAAGHARDVVDVRLPATSAYLSVLRTATAGLAARLDFTVDEIEDLRIAVDEACAMLLPQAGPGSELSCTFELDEDALGLTVTVPSPHGRAPARETFAWKVLSALAGDVDAGVSEQIVWISLRKRRAHSPTA